MVSSSKSSLFTRIIGRPLRIRLCLVLFSTLPTLAYGLPISIVDCDGITRASKSVDAASRADVQIDVTGPNGGTVDGVDVTLTNTTTGETLTATVENGIVSFPEVSGGTWVMGSSTPNLFFSTIVLQGQISAIAATGAAVGAGVAGGGAVVGVVEVADGLAASPEPDPTAAPTPEPTPIPTSTPTVCPECNPDEEAPTIDDFFNKQQQPAAGAVPPNGTRQTSNAISPQNQPTEKRLTSDDCFIGDEVTPMSPFS